MIVHLEDKLNKGDLKVDFKVDLKLLSELSGPRLYIRAAFFVVIFFEDNCFRLSAVFINFLLVRLVSSSHRA